MRNVEFNGLGLQETPLDRQERWWGKDPVTDHVTRGHILKFVMADILGFIFLCSLLAEDGRTLHTNTGLPPGGSSLFESQMGKIMAWGHSSDGPSPMLWRAEDLWDFYSNRTEKSVNWGCFQTPRWKLPVATTGSWTLLLLLKALGIICWHSGFGLVEAKHLFVHTKGIC